MLLPDDITALAEKVVELFIWKKKKLALAESCTGGLVAAALTSIAGSSAMFERGFVTYANEAKQDELGVPEDILITHGAVSAACAHAMAEGARKAAKADLGLSITGIAGPGGGGDEKPVGLVFIACATEKGCDAQRFKFEGTRDDVRRQALVKALSWLNAAGKEL